MAHSKNKTEARLQRLIGAAQEMNIEVRTETLMREVGYKARSGRCRFKGRDIILIDREMPLPEQVEFLAAELGQGLGENNLINE